MHVGYSVSLKISFVQVGWPFPPQVTVCEENKSLKPRILLLLPARKFGAGSPLFSCQEPKRPGKTFASWAFEKSAKQN